jgi:hypothetical protein
MSEITKAIEVNYKGKHYFFGEKEAYDLLDTSKFVYAGNEQGFAIVNILTDDIVKLKQLVTELGGDPMSIRG